MPSRREQIVQAIVAALDGADKPEGLTVHRSRVRPIEQDDLPACVVYLHAEQSARGDGPHGYKTRRALTVRVECRAAVTGDDTTAPDAALDPLTAWAVAALMADPTLGRLAINTQDTAGQWTAVEAEGATLCAAAVDFSIDYLTARADPASA